MKRTGMTELKSLNLRKCKTVADIVNEMLYCSFGARMLAEAAQTIYDWIQKKEQLLIIYDCKQDSPLGKLLVRMCEEKNWFKNIFRPDQYENIMVVHNHNILVIGSYSNRYEELLLQKSNRAIFINSYGMAPAGKISDGYFPDIVFTDPCFIIPILFAVLEERLEGKKTTISDFIANLSQYGGLAKEIATGAETFKAMVCDPKCAVFLTLSGAMTIAKMSLVICDMIDSGMVQAVASTGALMAHGFIESLGLKHYKYDHKISDYELAKKGLNRVTDTLEPETNFDQVDEILEGILKRFKDKPKPISPTLFHSMVGQYLAENYPNERGILKSAYQRGVPVFVPAFVDSEIGNDLYVHNIIRQRSGKKPIIMNLEKDTKIIIDIATHSKRMGIFTIGGGVPRNNIQNVAPLLEIMRNRIGDKSISLKQFSYGCRICPDPMWYGHLSGCTYSEGTSWRKMDPNGKFSEIHCDATIALPFIIKYVMEGKDEK